MGRRHRRYVCNTLACTKEVKREGNVCVNCKSMYRYHVKKGMAQVRATISKTMVKVDRVMAVAAITGIKLSSENPYHWHVSRPRRRRKR